MLIVVDGGSSPYGQGAGEHGWGSQVYRDSQRDEGKPGSGSHIVINQARPQRRLDHIVRHIAPGIVHDAGMYGSKVVRILTAGLNEAARYNGKESRFIEPTEFLSLLRKYDSIGRAAGSKAVGISTIYIGPQVIDETKTLPSRKYNVSIRDDDVEMYADIVEHHATEVGSPFVDVRELFAPYIGTGTLHLVQAADGIHYTREMHDQVHDRVIAELSGLGVNFLNAMNSSGGQLQPTQLISQ